MAMFSFGSVVYTKVYQVRNPNTAEIGQQAPTDHDWYLFAQNESGTLALIVIGVITASVSKRLLTTARLSDTRTIPLEDFELISQAVKEGRAEPIDQYLRLRALSGAAGTFTKLGITGLPLTTVLLTLIFSVMAFFPGEAGKSFLDLAKLTLGAFIGSFVQRSVEQRRQETKPIP